VLASADELAHHARSPDLSRLSEMRMCQSFDPKTWKTLAHFTIVIKRYWGARNDVDPGDMNTEMHRKAEPEEENT
jgi:hypothetical protein